MPDLAEKGMDWERLPLPSVAAAPEARPRAAVVEQEARSALDCPELFLRLQAATIREATASGDLANCAEPTIPDWVGQDWVGQDWVGQDWVGQDWVGQDWVGQDWVGQDWAA
jgi:hypothetical protein